MNDAQVTATELPRPSEPFQEMLIRHLPDVRRAVRSLARCHRLAPDEEGDLLGDVLVRLVADDYDVLRRFRGQSALSTYLRVVAYRILLDGRVRRWGKWRPSRRALAHGSAAVRFERMVAREGLPVVEALAATEYAANEALDPQVAYAIAAHVARRGRARTLAPGEAAVEPVQERALESRDLARYAAYVGAVVRRSLRDLSDEDYQMLRRRFVGGESVAELARTDGANQKALYRRQERILRRLRSQLGHARLVRHELRALIGHPDVEVPGVFEERLSA